jgi:phage terminase large subunit
MRADSARPETIDYCRRHGFPKIRGAKKGKGSVEDGISFLQGMQIVVHPRCANFQREIASYAHKTDPRTGEILPVIEDRNNHLIDALRYACEGLHRRGKMIDAPPPPPKRNPLDDYLPQGHDEDVDEWKIA